MNFFHFVNKVKFNLIVNQPFPFKYGHSCMLNYSNIIKTYIKSHLDN